MKTAATDRGCGKRRHDEWLNPERLFKYNEANLAKQRQMQQASAAAGPAGASASPAGGAAAAGKAKKGMVLLTTANVRRRSLTVVCGLAVCGWNRREREAVPCTRYAPTLAVVRGERNANCVSSAGV